ncbi:SH3 domain-containing protein [Rubinisphaera italica]|uniref:Bacterial SH3 domain protein n=1 Tax=Rubinisphaera italica TaxID=2527969 RepID=A0A5C5XI26_9PLAN|nr:SH3 domain-containing protein [Rubinisphaera italica]TWT62369.1 hypothetical protein Pan54_31100 [Rubinisphaera italica]
MTIFQEQLKQSHFILFATSLLFFATGCSNQTEQSSPSPKAAPVKPLGPPPEGQSEPEVSPEPKTSMTHSISVETEYYKGGPQQGSPPDGKLTAGTEVKLVESAGSYSLIETAEGEQAYISSDALNKIAGR